MREKLTLRDSSAGPTTSEAVPAVTITAPPPARYPLPELGPETERQVYARFSATLAANTVMPDVLTWESTDTVDNRPASARDLRRALGRLPLAPTLQILGTIAVEIERGRRPIDAALQVRVARRFGASGRRGRGLERRLLDTPSRALVSEDQVAVLAAYAIRYCEAKDWPTDGDALVLNALLAYNSLKGQELLGDGDTEGAMRRTEMRSTSTDPESVPDVLKRWDTFARWTNEPEGQAASQFFNIDVAALFTQELGLSPVAWSAATWALTGHFQQIKRLPSGARHYDVFLDIDAYLAPLSDRTEIDRWLDQTTISIDDARPALGDLSTTSLAELEVFMDRPLVRTPWGLCCPVLRFLPNVAGNGLVFRLGRHLEKTSSRQASDDLRGLFGRFLEAHIESLIRDATRNRSVQIFREQKYGRPEMKSSDIVVFDGDAAVFIDVTATRFNQRQSVVALNDKTIERDIQRFVTDKVKKEIARCACDFRSGILVFQNVDPTTIKHIYGLVISPQGMPRLIGLTRIIDRLVPDMPDGLQDWEFFDVNEIEALPKIFPGTLDLAQLIADKRADAFGRPRSLTNYVYYRRRSLLRPRLSPQQMLRDPWIVQIVEYTKTWGLGTIETPTLATGAPVIDHADPNLGSRGCASPKK